MSISANYPNGFAKGHTSFEIPLIDVMNSDGNVFWVDSTNGLASDSAAGRGTFNLPFATIDYAIGRCTANNGDIIIVAAGHTETVIAAAGLALDVAGITIRFMGEGANRGTITFTTAVTADMNVDAANVTMINPRFTAGIDALTAPIDVNAANFKIIGGTWEDGTSIDTTDCLVAAATATGLELHGFEYIAGDEGGTQKQSFIQLNGVDNAILTGIKGAGDFGTGIIENVTDEVLNIHFSDIYLKNTNASPTPCMVLDANATGYADRVNCRVASGTTYVSSVAKLNWTGTCLGYNADGEGGDPIGTADASSIEGKIDALAIQAGTVISVQKTLVSSAVLQAGVDITGVSSAGDLLIEDVVMSTDATGLAVGTNFTIESDNANGVAVFFGETVANLGANKTESLATGSVTAIAGVVLETGKKLIAKSTVADCTGAGEIDITIKFRRLAAGATIASA